MIQTNQFSKESLNLLKGAEDGRNTLCLLGAIECNLIGGDGVPNPTCVGLDENSKAQILMLINLAWETARSISVEVTK